MDTPISKAEAIKRGLKHYFTGKPCKHGHVAKRAVVNNVCHDCKNEGKFRASRRADPRISMVRNASYRARMRGLPFTITIDDVVIPEQCPCCSIRLVPRSERIMSMKTGQHDTPSLDRKVPKLGYVPGNVAVLCMACNAKKSCIDENMLKFLLEYLS